MIPEETTSTNTGLYVNEKNSSDAEASCAEFNQTKMKKIKVTQEEIYDAMKPNVYKNKKKYTRKNKHNKN